jgi:hypothetical protein
VEENTQDLEKTLSGTFEQALAEAPAFAPEDLPMDWEVGQHKYIRVLDQEGALDKKLLEFRELGVKVLDYGRRWGFWVFKTMAPQ